MKIEQKRDKTPKKKTTFFLGIHQPLWLCDGRITGPAFVSIRSLSGRKSSWPNVTPCAYAIDSGGFTELHKFGEYRTTPKDYAKKVMRCFKELGPPVFAAAQDFMCEDSALKSTGLTVQEHQTRSVESVLRLRDLEDRISWLPVLQGREPEDYLRHFDQYERAGFDLTRAPRVGVGSICRRQKDSEILRVIRRLSSLGLRLHGFGVKATGLSAIAEHLDSADSMAWSFAARRSSPHRTVMANCPYVAEKYRVFMDCIIIGEGVSQARVAFHASYKSFDGHLTCKHRPLREVVSGD